MAKARKKPVVIWAIKIEQEYNNLSEISKFFGDFDGYSYDYVGGILIETLEGVMLAREGDWIIKGVNGEFYPCKPDIFEKTYDIIEE